LGQEFVIKSTVLEDKINELLPSQGGAQAGVDLSASSMIVPIIDLTESAEGSTVRADLQSSLSLTSVTAHNISNTTSTLINTTGYFRVFGVQRSYDINIFSLSLTDGTTTKKLIEFSGTTGQTINDAVDFIVYLRAGDSLTGTSSSSGGQFNGVTRQIADINGNLVDP